MLRFIAPTLLAIACVAGCSKDNPNYCPAGSQDCNVDAMIDTPPVMCSTSGPDPECPDLTPVCSAGVCAGCTGDPDCAGRPAASACFGEPSGGCYACDEVNSESPECPAGMPICDGTDHTCRACRADDECESGVCESNQCVPASDVIYMTPGGSGSTCTSGAPCRDLVVALGLVAGARRYVSMENGTYQKNVGGAGDIPTLEMGDNGVIVGHGSTLVSVTGGSGFMIEVKSGANLAIRDLTVDGTQSDDIALRCSGNGTALRLLRTTVHHGETAGVSADCRLELTDTIIRDNGQQGIVMNNNGAQLRATRVHIDNNSGAGISVSSASSIVVANSRITRNAQNGGAQISLTSITNLGNSRFVFNTIADGRGNATVGGIDCNGVLLPIENSILYANAGTADTDCTLMDHTLVQDGLAVPDMVIVGNPMFGADYHITAAGDADGAADPDTSLVDVDGVEIDVDMDGDARPQGALDVGADEIP